MVLNRCNQGQKHKLTSRQSGTRLGIVIPIGLCALVTTVVWAPIPAYAATPGLFGTIEVPHTSLKPFPKWTGVLKRYFKEQKKRSGNCVQTRFNKCYWIIWNKLLDSTRDESPKKQLNLVNTFMNRFRYIVDPINWGVKDYWASPPQFFKKYGDCEDYAIAKYMSLKALGWNPKDMRIIVVNDMNLKIAHAVLAVKLDGKEYILDNQISIVITSTRIRHYRPIYSVNEFGWWRHYPKRAKRKGSRTRKVIRIRKRKK